MSDEDSLSQSMDIAVKRYSSLFRLPSYRRVLLFQALLIVIGLLLATFVAFQKPQGITIGLAMGFSVLSIGVMLDYVVSVWVLKDDAVFDFRRTAALSLYCWMLWMFFIFVGSAISIPFGLRWWIRFTLLGFSAVLIFRSVVFNAISTMNSLRIFAATFLQPLLCTLPFLVVWTGIDHVFTLQFWSFFIFSAIVAIGASHLFLGALNRLGMKTVGIASLPIFKAFLLNWIIGLNSPLEEALENLGEEQDTSISLVKFVGSKTKIVIAVPSIHPGPFKNVGSSQLPSLLKASLERELNCIACVPHGLSGHEVDLASQAENQKVINCTLGAIGFPATEGSATSLVTASNSSATSCCQMFGNIAFISFTLAPKTTEDFPPEFGEFVRQEAAKLGIDCCVIVNAHNSIGEEPNSREALESLKQIATECLRKAVSEKQMPFEVGADTVNPKEFSLEDGMGAGGITVVVFKTGRNYIGYVVIDGNNIVSGLREKIQSALASKGISKSEVFTTDTHSVNAVVLTKRGYNPVGETMDLTRLISYIEKAAVVAMEDLESANAGCCEVPIAKVRVIGEKQLETLCLLIDKSVQRAKRIAAPLFIGSGLLLMLFLMLL